MMKLILGVLLILCLFAHAEKGGNGNGKANGHEDKTKVEWTNPAGKTVTRPGHSLE